MSAAALGPGEAGPSVIWLAAHELRLAWRDWRGMITAGNRRRFSTALLVLAVVGLGLHLPAWAIVARFGESGLDPDKGQLLSLSLIVLLYLSLLLSQAMESVTRTLYSRGDLDLVLSSPVPPRRLFAVRIAANAVPIAIMAAVLSAPFIDSLTVAGGPRWLAAYVVAVAFGLAMSALAVALTIGLFRLFGPRRTRIVAQVIAAVIGAAFAIGIQIAAIFLYGNLATATFVASAPLLSTLPGIESPLWLPARAILGDWTALAFVVAAALVILAAVVAVFAPRLGEHSIAATDLAAPGRRRFGRGRMVIARTAASAMRRKEWTLLRRDPWLISQTLTQLLYLLPPAVLLSRNFGASAGVMVVVVMVLVTVGGQLGGALAWLAISGEDAPDLVATAPVAPGAVTRAKVEAVFGAVVLIVGPVVAAFALLSPWHAGFAALGIAFAAASTIRIQLWFRAQAKRTNFRRRHTSSRIATFGEALVSFSWAAAAGFAAAEQPIALISVAIALLILFAVRAVSPRKAVA